MEPGWGSSEPAFATLKSLENAPRLTESTKMDIPRFMHYIYKKKTRKWEIARRLEESTKMEPAGNPANQLFDHRVFSGDRLAPNPPQERPRGSPESPQIADELKCN